jgi:hypothetical protein
MVCEKKKEKIKMRGKNAFHGLCMNEIHPFRIRTHVGTAVVFRLTGNGIRISAIRIPARARDLSRLQNVQTGSVAHPTSY